MIQTNLKLFFRVPIQKYDAKLDYIIIGPASLDNPKNNAVMFVTEGNLEKAKSLQKVENCLVFWPNSCEMPEELVKIHALIPCANPHFEFCKFFADNCITNLPQLEKTHIVNGAIISKTAKIGFNSTIFPGTYIGGEVEIGNHVFLGAGSKLVGKIQIGNNVIIRENVVIGADGLTTDRDEHGKAVTMPQFGGVIIEDEVSIGANTVIARGAIDDTIICRGSKIDNSCFISHNVRIGADSFIVGESIFFGSSSTGEQVLVSGNATIRNGIHIGNKSIVGMGSVVVKSVPDETVVKGNPAK
jgi:UDP-3-O-[3-hydroxymyristoyl] glucosamine N-acyltransferase